jgi:hypothetical protein
LSDLSKIQCYLQLDFESTRKWSQPPEDKSQLLQPNGPVVWNPNVSKFCQTFPVKIHFEFWTKYLKLVSLFILPAEQLEKKDINRRDSSFLFFLSVSTFTSESLHPRKLCWHTKIWQIQNRGETISLFY